MGEFGTVKTLTDFILWAISKVPSKMIRVLPTWLGRRRLLAVLASSLAIHPRRFRTRSPFGPVFEGHTSDVIQRMVYVYGVWEPEISAWVRGFLRPGDRVIDVGANWGFFSIWASTCVGEQGDVIAIEPVPSIFRSLERNVQLSRLNNIRATNLVLSDVPGEVEVFLATPENLGNSSTVAEPGFISEGATTSARGDDLINVDDVRLIKIDTEGDEYRVLQGFSGTLNRMASGSAVLVEITPEKLAFRGHDAASVWSLFPEDKWLRFQIVNDYSEASYAKSDFAPPRQLLTIPMERVDVVFLRR